MAIDDLNRLRESRGPASRPDDGVTVPDHSARLRFEDEGDAANPADGSFDGAASFSANPPDSRDLLSRLVSFDTTSSKFSLDIVNFISDYLAGYGIASDKIYDSTGRKANLWATIGPRVDGGVILSGHMDCVPVDGQDWSSDPFTLTERDGLLYGRGAADMKGFLACVLAAVPRMAGRRLAKPVHLAFSYDEELGCLGVRDLIAHIVASGVKPSCCIVGEPTSMRLVNGHKGGLAYRCRVDGLEAHSGLAPIGVNAIHYAARLITFIADLADELALGPHDEAFDIAHSTLSTGLIDGGTAANIVPGACEFTFDFRNIPRVDQQVVIDRIAGFANDVLVPQMREVHPQAGIHFEEILSYPGCDMPADDPLVSRMAALTGSNDLGKVAFGTEAGLFMRDLGVPTLVCGPGDIAVAHKRDEFVPLADLEACDRLVAKLWQEQAEGEGEGH